MGRKTDVLLKGFRAAKCATLIKVATARIKVVRNKRSIAAKQMRVEIAQLIKSGQDAHVYITKADALIKQENMVAVYGLIDQYCHAIMSRFPAIEMQRNCPADMKEPIASIMYAAPRCIELSELPLIKEAFVAKYGKEFGAAASELKADCGVSRQIIELLSTRPATGEMKLKLMREICKENNVDWTPGETLAGSAVGTGQAEVKVEPMKATGTVGSIKVNAVGGVSEAGPSKIEIKPPPQGGSKHGVNNKFGLAEGIVSTKAEVLHATDASKTSVQKQTSSSEGVAPKAKPNVSQSLKVAMSTAASTKESCKAAMLAAEASKVDATRPGASEEEDARRLNARILQSLKGAGSSSFDTGSYDEPEGEPEMKAEVSKKPSDEQVELSDSDSDSFVSVEDGRFEDDVEPLSDGAALRKESFGKNPLQGFAEADLNLPSLSKKLSERSQQEIYSSASTKNSGAAMEMHEDMLASSKYSSLSSKSSHEGMFPKVSSKKSFNAKAVLEEESRKNSLPVSDGASSRKESFGKNSLQSLEEADLNRPSLSKKLSERSQQEIYSRASSKTSGAAVEMHEDMLASTKYNSLSSESSHEGLFKVSSKKSFNAKAVLEEESRKNIFNKGKLAEAQSFEESRENRMKHERVAEELVIETSGKEGLQGKDSLEDKSIQGTKKIVEPQSFEDLKENRMIHKKVAEELSVEKSDKDLPRKDSLEDKSIEALQRKDTLENKSIEVTTENSDAWELSEKYSFGARKTVGVSDEGRLQGEDIINGMPSMATIENSAVEKHVEEYPLDANQQEIAVGEEPRLPAKDQSFPDRVFDEEMSSRSSEEPPLGNEELPEHAFSDASKVFGEEPSSSSENALKIGKGELDSLPAVGKGVEELVAASSLDALATLETSQDFAAAAKAIAAEAARLAILDYAKRIAESSSISLDLGELSKLGFAFQENKEGLQVKKSFRKDSKSESFDSGVGHGGDSMRNEKDVIKEEKRVKVETALNDDKGYNSDHADVDEISANIKKFKAPVADDAIDGNLNASATAEEQQEMVTDNEDINPFATSIATNTAKDSDSLISKREDEVSWAAMPLQTSKIGTFGQDDHLDIFFRRKTAWMPEEKPVFDGYSFVKPKSSYIEEKMPYDGSDKKKSSSQEDLFPKPLFDTISEGQSTLFKGSSDSSKSPVFDEGDGGSFKSPVFDEGPEPYDPAFLSDDGLDKSNLSAWVSDKEEIFPHSIQNSARFDLEPEPCFDKVADDEELFNKERAEKTGQLKWQSTKPISSVEHAVTGNIAGSSVSDTSLGGSGNPMSRRSRRQPKQYDDSEYDGGSSSRYTRKSSSLQQQAKEPSSNDKNNLAEKLSLGTEPARPSVYSSSAMSQRPSNPPRWASGQADPLEGLLDEWDSTPTQIPSKRTTASPIRLVNRQKERDEEFYFPEEVNHLGSSSAGNSTSRRTTKPPTRMGKPMAYNYVDEEDDPAVFKISHNNSRIPTVYQQVMVEDDRFDELQGKYKPSLQTSDMSKSTSAGSGIYGQQWHHHRQEEPHLGSAYKKHRDNVSENLRSRPMSSRQQPEKYIEEEPDLVSRYKPIAEDNEPLSYKSSNKYPRRPKVHEPEKGIDEDSEEEYMLYTQTDDLGMRASASSGINRRHEQHLRQEEYPLESGYMHYEQANAERERIPTSRLSAAQKQPDFEEEQDMASGYKPSKQVDNRAKSRPSRPLPSRQQEKRRIEEVAASSGINMRHEQRLQPEEDPLESGYMHYKQANTGRERISTSRLSAAQKQPDFEDLAADYKPSKQVDSRVKSPLRPLPSRQQEKKCIEEVEATSMYTEDDDMVYCQEEEDEEEQHGRLMSSQHKHHPQQKKHWPKPSDDHEDDPKFERFWQQEHTQKENQQPLSVRQKKHSLAEEEVQGANDKQHLPSPSYKDHEDEGFIEPHVLQQEKQRHKVSSLPEEQEEQGRRVTKPSSSPLRRHKQDIRPEDNSLESSQQEQSLLDKQDGTTSGYKAQAEGVNEQQEKVEMKIEPPSKLHQSQVKEEMKIEPPSKPHQSPVTKERTNGQQDKPVIKSQLLTEPPSQPISSPLESSISDPIVLATIPPPIKKPVTPSPATTMKLESSYSAPSASKAPEVKTPKVAHKAPTIDDLAANFEAFRKARKGE